jgi:beta-phosphoglucomutase-like phosphatase (HAD superfamily)
LVLEDSLAGVTAGLAAGCLVIAIPTIYAKGIDYPKEALIKEDLFEAIEEIKKI